MLDKGFVLYSIGSLIAQGLQMAGMALAVYVLTPNDLGLFSLCLGFQTILALVLSMGLRQVVTLDYFHCSSEQQDTLIATVLLIYGMIALPLVGILLLSLPWVTSWVFMGYPDTMAPCALAIVNAFLLFFTDFLYQILSYQRQAGRLIYIRIASGCFVVLLNCLLAYSAWVSPATFLWAYMGGLLIQIYYGARLFVLNKRAFFWKDSLIHIRSVAIRYVRLGLAFVPSLAAAWILSSSSRWVLAHYSGLETVALFSVIELTYVAFNAAILTPLGAAYVPHVLEDLARNPQQAYMIDRHNKRIMWGCIFISIMIMGLLFWAGKPLMVMLIPGNYAEAITYVPLRCASALLYMGTYFTTCYIQARKKIFFLIVSLVSTATINLITSIYLTQLMGLSGALWALCLSNAWYFGTAYAYNEWLHYTTRSNKGACRDDAVHGAALLHTLLPTSDCEPLDQPQERDQRHSIDTL